MVGKGEWMTSKTLSAWDSCSVPHFIVFSMSTTYVFLLLNAIKRSPCGPKEKNVKKRLHVLHNALIS